MSIILLYAFRSDRLMWAVIGPLSIWLAALDTGGMHGLHCSKDYRPTIPMQSSAAHLLISIVCQD